MSCPSVVVYGEDDSERLNSPVIRYLYGPVNVPMSQFGQNDPLLAGVNVRLEPGSVRLVIDGARDEQHRRELAKWAMQDSVRMVCEDVLELAQPMGASIEFMAHNVACDRTSKSFSLPPLINGVAFRELGQPAHTDTSGFALARTVQRAVASLHACNIIALFVSPTVPMIEGISPSAFVSFAKVDETRGLFTIHQSTFALCPRGVQNQLHEHQHQACDNRLQCFVPKRAMLLLQNAVSASVWQTIDLIIKHAPRDDICAFHDGMEQIATSAFAAPSSQWRAVSLRQCYVAEDAGRALVSLVSKSEQLSVVDLIGAQGLTATTIDQLLDILHVELVCVANAEIVGTPVSTNIATKLITADASAWRRDPTDAARHRRCYRQLDLLGLALLPSRGAAELERRVDARVADWKTNGRPSGQELAKLLELSEE
jgi:hypothetical protein